MEQKEKSASSFRPRPSTSRMLQGWKGLLGWIMQANDRKMQGTISRVDNAVQQSWMALLGVEVGLKLRVLRA
jgi:hypothetical protein